jgi:hypothetical protein
LKAWIAAAVAAMAFLVFAAAASANHGNATAMSINPASGSTITTAATNLTATFTFDNPVCGEAGTVVAVASSGAVVQTSLTCDAPTSTWTWTGTWSGYGNGAQSVSLTFNQTWGGGNHNRGGIVVGNYIVDLGSPAAIPATKDDCKSGAWMTLEDSAGNGFKNQGDCVSFVATDGKNLGSVAP